MAFTPILTSNPTLKIGLWQEDSSFIKPLATLAYEENIYLQKITHFQRRQQSHQARLCLHTLLSDLAPFIVKVNALGKPYLVPPLGFISLAHTRNASVVIYSSTYKVGIDIESLKRNYQPYTTRYFMSAQEKDWFEQANLHQKTFIYFLTWCAKEAIYKLLSPFPFSISFSKNFSLLPSTLGKETIQTLIHLPTHTFQLWVYYLTIQEYIICYVWDEPF
ncbi:MAG: 4'-phosphopantetheinyl transferase superfamily protein [Bacteroidia bacterium]|nr:4'-phosphopantetheinyl transferase superfamily protein [Bacteroidia bacterium]MDW8157274.1 4'-phosphopantetheinyl transferase superfamily protein [Bacteroidia bacterium]